MLSATDAFPDMTPADQRHTPVVIGDHFSDIDEDDQESEAASQSSYIDLDDEAHSRTGDVSVAHDMCDDVAVDVTADVAAPIGDTDDTFGAAATRPTVAQLTGAQETADATASAAASAVTVRLQEAPRVPSIPGPGLLTR